MIQLDINEHPRHETKDDLTSDALKKYDANIEVMNLILISITNDIYISLDSCQTAQEMWLRVERLMHGTALYVVDRETQFNNEFDQLAKKDEAGVIISNEQNDFLLSNSVQMEELEELSANIFMMARIQPAHIDSDEGPSYDSTFIIEEYLDDRDLMEDKKITVEKSEKIRNVRGIGTQNVDGQGAWDAELDMADSHNYMTEEMVDMLEPLVIFGRDFLVTSKSKVDFGVGEMRIDLTMLEEERDMDALLLGLVENTEGVGSLNGRARLSNNEFTEEDKTRIIEHGLPKKMCDPGNFVLPGNEGYGMYKKIEGDIAWHAKFEVIKPSGRKFTRGFKTEETKRKLSRKFTSEDILNFDETLKELMKFEYLYNDGDVFTHYSWERSLSIEEDVYLLCGREHVLTLPQFAVLLGLYEESELEHRTNPRTSLIKEPLMKIMHRLIVGSLVHKLRSRERCQKRDLWMTGALEESRGGYCEAPGDDYFADSMPSFGGTSIIPSTGYEVEGSSGAIHDDDDTLISE
uniref:Uncharacterized protein n=1 Tax=Tanacetum cinerariifolium TaxID=118510 RepID=A0A6L2KL73_TANCI|nr:hypothetical protein [Tanacetum cinerariifolium]